MTAEAGADRYSLERYIERVNTATGELLAEPIRPEELLVHSHRDFHPVDVHAGFMMSRTVRATGSVQKALHKWWRMRSLAWRASTWVARALGRRDPAAVARTLFGLEQISSFFRYHRQALSRAEVKSRLEAVRAHAASGLCAARSGSGIRVLLTGGTGFLGQELIAQAVQDPAIAEVVVLIRPREIRDRQTGAVLETRSPTDRGERLLRRLAVDRGPNARGPDAKRIRFLAGDIEKPMLGLGPAEIEDLARRITHVVHCAASVAFDATYEDSFRANVEGTRRVLELSEKLHGAEQSPFVAHLAIETSYIHGRQTLHRAREEAMIFPGGYYNNYYELTKAMASLEAESALLYRGLPVVHLCPSIVIGDQRTGNNRGDTKVVNAPVNLFGRTREALEEHGDSWLSRSKAALLARLACVFPGHPSAEINLIPVDWVAAGILAAVHRPEAAGERIHLANDRRLTADQMAHILEQELGVRVQLAEPTLHRNVGLPLVRRALGWAQLEGLANVMTRMNRVFGGYSEWGQTIHEVGNDVRLLGLPAERPDPERSFRLLCRHNRWVQDFGRIRDRDELARREALWSATLEELERRQGTAPGALDAETFRAEIERVWPFPPPRPKRSS